MKISKRKRRIIIKLAEDELNKEHSDKALKQNLRSIIAKMKDSIADTELNNERKLYEQCN